MNELIVVHHVCLLINFKRDDVYEELRIFFDISIGYILLFHSVNTKETRWYTVRRRAGKGKIILREFINGFLMLI